MLRIITAGIVASLGCSAALADSFTEDQACRTVAPAWMTSSPPYEVCEGSINGFQFSWRGTHGTIYKAPLEIKEKSRLGPEADIIFAQTGAEKVEVMCERDKMTDRKSCTLFNWNRQGGPSARMEAVFFVVGYGEKSAGRFCIGGDHFPGSQIRLRLDGGKLMARSERAGCFPAATIRQVLKADKVITQYMKWPYQTWVTDEGDTAGLTEAMKLADFLLGQL